jgi:acetylglutamate kinase
VTYVLKLGGEVVGSDLLPILAADLARVARAIVVHGGGAQATAMQKRLGQEPKIVSGRRITDADTLDVMKMIVAGKLNVDLCSALVKAGARPVGLHGASSQAIRAEKRAPKVLADVGPDPIDFGFVGDVVGLNLPLISLLLDAGYLPVLACLGADATGQVYNINADTVANGVATNVGAEGLVLISDVPGVLRDIRDPSSRIAHLTKAEAEAAIKDGVVTKGMIPKLEEAFAAVAAGVKRVFILGKLGPGELFRALSEPGSVGTVLR